MLMQQSSGLATAFLFALISAEAASASNIDRIGVASAAIIPVAGEIDRDISQQSLSLDAQQDCQFSSTNLNHLDTLTRARICSELTQMHESLQRLRIGMASFREFTIVNERRCNQLYIRVVEKTNRLRERDQELLNLQQERDQLKSLLADFNLTASE